MLKLPSAFANPIQPEQSALTRRTFELPADARDVGLIVDHDAFPICLIIGECSAFHRAPVVHISVLTAAPRGAQIFGSVLRKNT